MTAERSWISGTPIWWRLIAWGLLVGDAIYAGAHPLTKVAAGLLMAVSALALQYGESAQLRTRQIAAVVAGVTGLAVILLAPNALGEVPVLIVASRMAPLVSGRSGRAILVAFSIAFGLAVGWATHSIAGLLAGTGIPLLYQRGAERQELVEERDRARALLVELEASRGAEAQAAATKERARIARDMHDVLAHSLAGLSLQLQATRAVAIKSHAGPEVIAPLDRAAELAREGLAEARSAVGALRDAGGLNVEALPGLVARYPGAARLDLQGTPGEVTDEVGEAVYRAVQESLTNAARYAPGSPVVISLDWEPERLNVRVGDLGPAPGHTALTGAGSGNGLGGMAERLTACGGSVRSGAQAGGGWLVEITAPTVRP